MKKLLSNILAWIAVLFSGASTFIGTIIVFIIISWKWDLSWWQNFLACMGFFLIWFWGGFFLSGMFMAASESLAKQAEQKEE